MCLTFASIIKFEINFLTRGNVIIAFSTGFNLSAVGGDCGDFRE